MFKDFYKHSLLVYLVSRYFMSRSKLISQSSTERLVTSCLLHVRQAWPEDALELVANKFLDDVEMQTEVRGEMVAMCKHFHQSVRALSVT